MKSITISFEFMSGYAFGASTINSNHYDELQDVVEYPFDYTTSMVCGPNKYWVEDSDFKVLTKNNESVISASAVRIFTANKDIDKSEFFNAEQAKIVKKEIKSQINDYYKSWRNGQYSNDDLLEVFEEGRGEFYATITIDETFNPQNLFFICGDCLSNDESVISTVGYLNTDGSITYSNFEYGNYRIKFTDSYLNGELIEDY